MIENSIGKLIWIAVIGYCLLVNVDAYNDDIGLDIDEDDFETYSAQSNNDDEDSLAMFPFASETRQPISLDGVWNFRITDYSLDHDFGFKHHWYNQSLDRIDSNYERMPVPSSYNDITENRELRDYVGWAWYDRKFFLPPTFNADSVDVILRFGSVNYKCSVWINGEHVMNHTGGHLPFQKVITKLLLANKENHISVAVNNELSAETIPPGKYKIKNDTRRSGHVVKFIESNFGFDFFNYAGIQRSVWLYLVPKIRITDITLITDIIDNDQASIHYDVRLNGKHVDGITLDVGVYDRQGQLVNRSKGSLQDMVMIEHAHLWWPFTMHPEPGYQYRLEMSIYKNSQLLDRYYQKVGIRTLSVDKQQFLVNGKAFYFRGFGKHEEYDVRGRSQDEVMIIKDFNLIKWIGANSFRTSHYPYSEQLMDEADEQGIAVVDECPAVGLTHFDSKLLKLHSQTIREMIQRDKNRPSVFMWSLSNEAVSSKPEAKTYYEKISSLARELDPSKRPLTAATNQYHEDYLPPVLDVVMVNRYYGWYIDNGYPQIIQHGLVDDFSGIWHKFQKPVMISEYGAESISGLHTEPSMVFTEDYQTELMMESHKAFDTLRQKGFFIGEHIWNFADFMTQQQTTRVGGNKKGIFTRQRQPKASARLLRCRYWAMANVTFHEKHQNGFSYCPHMQYQ